MHRDGQIYVSTSVPGVGRIATIERPAGIEVSTHPNPFNPTTTFTLQLPEAAHVRLTIYNVVGRKVARLLDSAMESGMHEVTFDASSLPSGVFFYRVDADDYSHFQQIVLMKSFI